MKDAQDPGRNETLSAMLRAAHDEGYASAMKDAEAIVRMVFDETPGNTVEVLEATVAALRRARGENAG